MVSEVFNFLCSALVILLLAEIAALVFVSVHEAFREKREQMRRYYRNKRNQKSDK
ncbi:MAG: hypothetical protein IJ682_00795 [Lachnospiraceae bacterium]|nr:hypothetical protein [Lachnospiraceae bacterium]